jgi:hypothetical protein
LFGSSHKGILSFVEVFFLRLGWLLQGGQGRVHHETSIKWKVVGTDVPFPAELVDCEVLRDE